MMRTHVLALAAVLAWPAAARAQTVIDREGVYPPGLYRGPCLDLDTHRDATPKIGDERRVKLVASLIRLGDATGPRLFKSAPPGCESIPLEPGEYAMQVSTLETRWRYLCRYTNQPADDCTEIAKETVLDTLYTSEFPFTVSEEGGAPEDPPRAGGAGLRKLLGSPAATWGSHVTRRSRRAGSARASRHGSRVGPRAPGPSRR